MPAIAMTVATLLDASGYSPSGISDKQRCGLLKVNGTLT
jgi:hypothetical protein